MHTTRNLLSKKLLWSFLLQMIPYGFKSFFWLIFFLFLRAAVEVVMETFFPLCICDISHNSVFLLCCLLFCVCGPGEMDECNFHRCRNHFVTKGCTHIVYGGTLCFRLYFRLEADYIALLHMSVYILLHQHAWRSNVIWKCFSDDPASKHVAGEHTTDLWPHRTNTTQHGKPLTAWIRNMSFSFDLSQTLRSIL